MHVASPTFRELEKLWDRQEETLAPTNINNGEDHSDNISHRADSVNNGRWDLNPAGNSEVQVGRRVHVPPWFFIYRD